MEYRVLGETGMAVSKLGLGCAPLGGVYSKTQLTEPTEIVLESLKAGVNFLDTAPWYGQGRSEENLGKALVGVPRSAYYIGSKVGRYEPDPARMFDFRAQRMESSVLRSLQLLRLPYLDLVHVHDVEYADSEKLVAEETLPALQRLQDAGKVRHIGISGYDLGVLESIVRKSRVRVETVLSHCRATLFDQSLADFLPFFQDRGIGVVNAAPTGMGLLTPQGPQPWHQAEPQLTAACRAAVDDASSPGMAGDVAWAGIAEAAVLFSVNFPGAATTLAGAHSRDVAAANLAAASRPWTPGLDQALREFRLRHFPATGAEDDRSRRHWEGKGQQEYWSRVASNVPGLPRVL